MAYTEKQRKVREYLLDNIDMQGYIEALDKFVKDNNTTGYYSRGFSHEQGFVLGNFTTLGNQFDLFESAIAYAGYKQTESDRTWASVITVYKDLLNEY